MIWLELRTNNREYDKGWNFSESVWAPIKKADGSGWPFWNLINQVSKSDIVFHIRKINGRNKFVGYSIAENNGYETYEKPTSDSHEWEFSSSFYRVDLTDYRKIDYLNLSGFFLKNDEILREYFEKNKTIKNKQRIFYVIQSNRVQCLNGAYFSELGAELSELLLKQEETINNTVSEPAVSNYAVTSTDYSLLSRRIGHQKFSDSVKSNFNHLCCFPGCNIKGKGFLVSGHIARWVDHENLRGDTSNGLCLCLIHDKAFEQGLFTLDENFKIKPLIDYSKVDTWLTNIIKDGENKEIKPRQINPSIEAIRFHWKRVGFNLKEE